MPRIGEAALAFFLAAGCTMPPGDVPPREEAIPPRGDARFSCNAAPIQSMLGRTGTRELGIEAVRLSNSHSLRWIMPDSAYTMDYRTDRLNIHLDARNRITRINCG